MLRSERNGDCWNNLTSLDMYISANSSSTRCRKRQFGVIMKRFRRIIVYAQKFTLVLSRQVYPSHAFSFRYIFLAKSHTNPSCGRFYAGNDPRRDAIMRINHSEDKRQPLLPILLPQSCPDFGSQLINQIIIIIIFVSPQQFSGFLNHVSSEQTWSALYNYAVKLRRDVVIRCNVIVPTIVSLRVTAVRMFLHGRLIDVDLISRRTSLQLPNQ
ncbi:hypothetical protein ALC57_07880 [Trachymyrmex cornetzi]|uniref:Uncharacterized protein n=1 Tax=Trachymyrmex cornetzi TaxID=471704 RepID=A0A195E4Q0_9HYME|nr:hypothetical protein ALC57_07880 [Trachymyrmex cornetzi]